MFSSIIGIITNKERNVKVLDFVDMVHELIAVDTDEGLVKESMVKGACVEVRLNDGSCFAVNVSKAARKNGVENE